MARYANYKYNIYRQDNNVFIGIAICENWS